MVDAADDSFADVADAAKIPVLVDLWAPWCGPCRMVSPALEQLARGMAGRLKLVKVNVDESPRLAERFAVQGIPTLLLLRGGEVVARQTGAAPEHALRAWLEQALVTSGS
jgi:thioredoxin 2